MEKNDEKVDESLEKTIELVQKSHNTVFWLYQYSKRHFFMKSEYADSIKDLLKDYGNIMEKLLKISINFQKQAMRCNNMTSLINIQFQIMASFLIYYHNLNHPDIKDSYLDLFNFIPNEDYEYVINSLDNYENGTLKVINSIAFDYGFYPWHFLSKAYNSDDILKKCLEGGDNYMLPNIPQFIKKDGVNIDTDIMQISYPTSSQIDSQWRNDAKYQLTIFIDPMDESVPMKKRKDEIVEAIKKCQEGQTISVGDASKAKIAIQVNVKAKNFTQRYVLHRFEHSIIAYRLYGTFTTSADGSKGNDKKLGKLYLKNIELLNLTRNKPYERRSPASRAIGLWLWDKVYAGRPKLTQAEAVNEILKKDLPPEFVPSEKFVGLAKVDVIRKLHKELELANRCIENRTVELLS